MRSNLLVTVEGDVPHVSNEHLVTSYIKDVLARTSDVVFGLTPEDTRKITPLVVELPLDQGLNLVTQSKQVGVG